jgi:hypothetical protein
MPITDHARAASELIQSGKERWKSGNRQALAGVAPQNTCSSSVFGRIDPRLRKSVTFDNDTTFAQHGLLRTMRDTTTWFCDAYASLAEGRATGRMRCWLQRQLEFRSSLRPRHSGDRCHRKPDAEKMSRIQNTLPGHPCRARQRGLSLLPMTRCASYRNPVGWLVPRFRPQTPRRRQRS